MTPTTSAEMPSVVKPGICPRCGDPWTDHGGVEEPICRDDRPSFDAPPYCDVQGCRGRWAPDGPHDRCEWSEPLSRDLAEQLIDPAEKTRFGGIRARIEELEAERPTFTGCKVGGCNWHTGGTAEGAEPAKCGGYGGPKGCLADFMAADPEDIDWTEYDR